MKKLFNILLAVLITIVCAFSLTACALDDNDPNKKTGLVISKVADGEYVIRDFVYVDGCLGEKGTLDIDAVLKAKGIPDDAEIKISAGAFDGDDKIKTLIVSEKVVEIEQGAFRKMKALETLEIPFVGKNAKTDAKFNQTLETEGKAVNMERTFSHFFGTEEYEKGRKMNNGYGDVYLPYTLKNVIVNATQKYDVSEETITIKEGYAIGYDAFKDARFLQNITLSGAKLREIGENAFSGCTALTSITIPSSIKTIYDNAFSGCINLTSVKFEGTGVVLNDNVFNGCSAMAKFNSEVDKTVDLTCFESIGLYALDFDRKVEFKVVDKAVNPFYTNFANLNNQTSLKND